MAACIEENNLWLVFEYMDQGSLYNLIHIQKKSMSLRELIITSNQIAEGMAFVHHSDIIHLDLKSKNILLGTGGIKVKKNEGQKAHDLINNR
jgi:serine/threonine protein kinase